MAFLQKRQPTNMNDQTGLGLYSEGSSGVSGATSGGVVSSRSPQSSKASEPGSWYNIQDFLAGNQSGIEQMQQSARDYASSIVDEDKKKTQSSISGLQAVVRPEASAFDSKKIGSSSRDEAAAGLSQDWLKPGEMYDYSPFSVTANEDLMGLKEGSRDDILTFNQKKAPPRSNYSAGARRMDDLLLGYDPEFVDSFAGDVKGQYQSSVLDPVTSEIENQRALDQSADESLDAARGGWFSGLDSYLGGVNRSVEDEFSRQKNLFDTEKGKSASSVLAKALGKGPELESSFTGKSYINPEEYNQMLNNLASQYASFSGIDPSMATATKAALGEQGVNQYNMLSELFNQYDEGDAYQDYNQMGGLSDFATPTWSTDTGGFTDYVRGVSSQREVSDLTPQLQDVEQEIASIDAERNKWEKIRDEAERNNDVAAGIIDPAWNEATMNLYELQKRREPLQSSRDDMFGRLSELTSFLNGR